MTERRKRSRIVFVSAESMLYALGHLTSWQKVFVKREDMSAHPELKVTIAYLFPKELAYAKTLSAILDADELQGADFLFGSNGVQNADELACFLPSKKSSKMLVIKKA